MTLNLKAVIKGVRTVHKAVANGRREVEMLRNGADVAMTMMDAFSGITGNIIQNPSVGTLAGTAAAVFARMVPTASAAPPVVAPVAPRPAARPRAQKPLRVTAEVIDAEIIEPSRKTR